MKRSDAEQIVKSIEANADNECAIDLKYQFGKSYREDMDVKTLVALIKATNLPTSSYDIDVAFIVATMYYSLKNKQGDTKIQSIFSRLYHDSGTSASMKKSIEELITSRDATTERFVNTLKRVTIAAGVSTVAIDYVSLCMDLSNWRDYAYKNWANEIILRREREEF